MNFIKSEKFSYKLVIFKGSRTDAGATETTRSYNH